MIDDVGEWIRLSIVVVGEGNVIDDAEEWSLFFGEVSGRVVSEKAASLLAHHAGGARPVSAGEARALFTQDKTRNAIKTGYLQKLARVTK